MPQRHQANTNSRAKRQMAIMPVKGPNDCEAICGYDESEMAHSAPADALPWQFLSASGRALLPNVVFDVGGTLGVYLALAPHFASSSIMPLLAASLVPIAGIALNIARKRRLDIIGVIVLVGILASIAGAAFGGSQRLLLLRESFSTGAIGLALVVSPVFPKSIGYYIMRHFIRAHETSHGLSFESLYESKPFRRTLSEITFFWGVLLLFEFGLRVFLALSSPVVFVLSVSPLILNTLMILGGIASAFWMARGIRLSLASP